MMKDGAVVWVTSKRNPLCPCFGRLVKHTSAGRGRYKDLPNLLICEKCWTAYDPRPHQGVLLPSEEQIMDPIDLVYIKSRRSR
jgi:hypothetical protein